MARVSKRKTNKKRVESRRMDEPLRREFEDSLGTVEIWGKDYSVASLMKTLHPFEFKMRYLRYLEDKQINLGDF